MAHRKLEIKKITSARINQERAGYSVTTRERLKFQVAHAQARDAVYAHWDVEQLKSQLESHGNKVLILNTLISSREEFLMKPHLGRCLNPQSIDILNENINEYDLVFCVSDGLSALAIQTHFLNFWNFFKPLIDKNNYKVAPIILVPYGRVAVENQIGELLNAKEVIIFIGERPGLSAHDSMGIYLTYAPKVSKKDSDSNCISNIHPPTGFDFKNASQNLIYLIQESIQRHYSGVNLKIDEEKIHPLSKKKLFMSTQSLIENKLKSFFNPTHLKVENESHLHSVPKGSETHFRIDIVSVNFEQKKLLERHRMVNTVIADEISKIRACSLNTFTSSEWEIRKNENFASPTCAGGPKIK